MRWVLLTALLLSSAAAPVAAVELAGVELPAEVRVDGIDRPLRLNGAGIRYKFVFKIYVAGLYLPAPESRAEVLLADPPANRVLMHFVYDAVSRKKLDAAWEDGFRANLDAQRYAALAPRIAQFKALFRTLREGDEVWLDHLPGEGTRVSINGEVRGLVPGDDFNAALLAIWLGPEPVTDSLKKALLATDNPG